MSLLNARKLVDERCSRDVFVFILSFYLPTTNIIEQFMSVRVSLYRINGHLPLGGVGWYRRIVILCIEKSIIFFYQIRCAMYRFFQK